MYQIKKYEELTGDNILIDVRTPSEYRESTIPGAINIPIFTDEQRKEIGTVYKRESIEKAKEIGIMAASENLPRIYRDILENTKGHREIILFCARGGYRSTALSSLFTSLDLQVYKLDGGYKGYRKFIERDLSRLIDEIKPIVLYGNTGTGKTKILMDLKEKGMDILDLEGCANHRGSILGSVGLGEQNSQKKFESLIHDALKNRKSRTVFIEGESRRIGKNIIPEKLFKKMKSGVHFKIQASQETRIGNLLEDYSPEDSGEIIQSLNYLRKHIGDKNIDNYIKLIRQGELKTVGIALMTKYYDPLYEHNKHEYKKVFSSKDSAKTAEELIKYVKEESLI